MARQERRPQTLGKAAVARVGYATWRQRIERQRGTRYWREIAVDVEDDVGGVGDINADRALIAGGNNGGVSLDAAVERVQGSDYGLPFAGRLYR